MQLVGLRLTPLQVQEILTIINKLVYVSVIADPNPIAPCKLRISRTTKFSIQLIQNRSELRSAIDH